MEFERIPPQYRPQIMLAVLLKSLGGKAVVPKSAFYETQDTCLITMNKSDEDGSVTLELLEGEVAAQTRRAWTEEMESNA